MTIFTMINEVSRLGFNRKKSVEIIYNVLTLNKADGIIIKEFEIPDDQYEKILNSFRFKADLKDKKLIKVFINPYTGEETIINNKKIKCAEKKINENLHKKILKNASQIAYYQNILNNSIKLLLENFPYYRNVSKKEILEEVLLLNEGDPHIAVYDDQFRKDFDYYPVPIKIYMYLAKGRKLKSALATPMARYYGYKALERKI